MSFALRLTLVLIAVMCRTVATEQQRQQQQQQSNWWDSYARLLRFASETDASESTAAKPSISSAFLGKRNGGKALPEEGVAVSMLSTNGPVSTLNSRTGEPTILDVLFAKHGVDESRSMIEHATTIGVEAEPAVPSPAVAFVDYGPCVDGHICSSPDVLISK